MSMTFHDIDCFRRNQTILIPVWLMLAWSLLS